MNSEYRIRTDRAIEKAIAKNAARPAVKMSGNRGYAVGSVPSPIGDFDFLIGRMASRGYVYDPDTPARGGASPPLASLARREGWERNLAEDFWLD